MTKKLYLIVLMTLVVITGFAQKRQTGDVIYVYQKDGNVHSFIRDEIEEMSYSNEGLDSLTYDDPVTQLIATADSIYRFALSEIDSISFVTPDAVYMPGVTPLEGEILQYVDRCDSLTIFFAANTPAKLLPKVGDKLGIGFLNDKFPEGFAGIVKSVSGTTVVCDQAELEDIFETLYCVATTDVSNEDNATTDGSNMDNAARRRDLEIVMPYEKDFSFNPFKYDLTAMLNNVIKVGSFAFKGENISNLTIKPTLHLKTEMVLRKPFGMRLSGKISGKVHVINKVAIYGSLEFAKDLAYSKRIGNFYGFGFDFKVGVFAKISADVTADIENRQQMEFSTGFALGTKGMVNEKPVTKAIMTENKTIFHKFSLDGLLGYGAVVEVGIAWVKDKIAKGVFRAEFGPQYRSNVILTNKLIENAQTSTALYDRLKNRTIQKYQVIGTSFDLYFMEKYGTSVPAPWGNEQLTHEWDIVPKFYNTELIQNRSDKTTADGSTVARGDCAFEHKLGMIMKDDKGRHIDMFDWTYLDEGEYKNGRQDMKYTFRDMKTDDSETYKLYPLVIVGGWLPILASPSADLEKADFPVRIVSFEQTGAYYSKQQGYEYDGRKYFYKFNATTTVELDKEAQNIKDWGYIYHDIYEEDKKISCANFGVKTFPDMRYAYYYNGPNRTVELRPYVQYEGETDIEVGDAKTYEVEYTHTSSLSCPDNNHPHAIDLGLPSHTLWACCNIGATNPEEHGEHYAWGMTTNVVGEKYPLGKTLWGTDIAGTEYDVACEKWGGAWRIPTREQMKELMDECPNEWVVIGGYDVGGGLRFTGPNGNSILLVAAGVLNDVGTEQGISDEKKPTCVTYSSFPYPWQPDPDVYYKYHGQYWTSTDSRSLEFNLSFNWGWRYTDEHYNTLVYYEFPPFKYVGIGWGTTNLRCSVRPVMKKK